MLEIFSLNNAIPKAVTIVYCGVVLMTCISLFFFKNVTGLLRTLIIVFINISFIFGAVYLYFGIRVASLYISKLKKKWILIIEFILLLIFPVFFVVLGIIDNFLSLQKKIYNKIKNTN